MDKMEMTGGFTTRIVSRILGNLLSKKLGIDADLEIDELHITSDSDAMELKITAGIRIPNPQLINLIKRKDLW